MFENYNDILTVDDVAEILKIGSTQAYKIIRNGELKAFKEGKSWKIPKIALIDYIKKHLNMI